MSSSLEIMDELRGPGVPKDDSGYGAAATNAPTDPLMEKLRGPVDAVDD